jgi:hypothetical protein
MASRDLVDERILDMAKLKAEQKKWAKLKKSSKRLRRRFKNTRLIVDPENPFCSEKRELDLQIRMAKNQNPRLCEPFQSGSSARRGGRYSFQGQLDGASEIYSIAKANKKAFAQPWLESPMSQLKNKGLSQGRQKREKWQRSLDKFNASILDTDVMAQITIEEEAREPKMFKHRAGEYHVPGQQNDTQGKKWTVSALYPLMSVLDLRNLLHNEPEHRPPSLKLNTQKNK